MIKDNPDIDSNDNNLVLLNSFSDNSKNKLLLKMYDTKKDRLVLLETADMFLPYTYFKLTDPNFDINVFNNFINENNTKYEVQLTEMIDLLEDIEVPILKLYSSNVYNVYQNLTTKLNNVQQYEYLIKYHESYIFEKQLIFSSNYNLSNKTLYSQVPILNDSQHYFLESTKFKAHNDGLISVLFSNKEVTKNKEYQKYLSNYTYLLNQPIPDFYRMALDIEILNEKNKRPDVKNATDEIISVSFTDNRGKNSIVSTKEFISNILSTKNISIIDQVCCTLKEQNLDLIFVDTELNLIEYIIDEINKAPIVVTFNGDDFDIAYINQRLIYLKDETLKEKNPIIFKLETIKKKNSNIKNPVFLKNSIHLDIFKLYKNISLQNYAFNAKYKEYSLNAVSKALLGKEKVDFKIMDELDSIKKMFDKNKTIRYDTIIEKAIKTLSEMYKYNLYDSQLTLELTTFSNNLTMNLIIILSRITKTSIEDLCRYGISNWVRSMLYFEHRKRSAIIPTGKDLSKKGTVASVESIIKNKGFRGAYVMNPVRGTHFNVTVLDFGSLYPSIIKSYNISYETLNCSHEECKNLENNKVKGTSHYICIKKHGLLSLLIGVLRDLRLHYFKKLSKQELNDNKEFFETVQQAIKVLLNGTYGVLGSEAFNMFCLPVAETVTAIARDIINQTIEYAQKELKIKVLYSDTDSVFCKDITEEQIKKLIDYTSKKFSIDLEIDKEFKFIIFSDLKKNYFGCLKNNKIVTAGLTGKKSNIPIIVRNCFKEITIELSKAENKGDMEKERIPKVKQIIKDYIHKIKNKKGISINDLIFNIMINREVDSYGKVKSVSNDVDGNEIIKKVGIPQQIKIAMEMNKNNPSLDISQNTVISFIKTKEGYKLPNEVSKSMKEIDTDKYVDTLKTSLNQILETLGISFDELLIKSQYLNTIDEMLGLNKPKEV